MVGLDFWLQILLVLVCLFYGARKGGMALGLIGGIGLIILIFGCGLKPGKPPVDVILTILAVVCGSATLQAAGGLDCLLQIAEKILRRNPRYVCYLAPYICWFYDRFPNGRDLLSGCCGCCVHDRFDGRLHHQRHALRFR